MMKMAKVNTFLCVCHKQQMVIITQTFPGVVMTGAGMAGLTYFANNQDDPYITLKDPVCNILLISFLYQMFVSS